MIRLRCYKFLTAMPIPLHSKLLRNTAIHSNRYSFAANKKTDDISLQENFSQLFIQRKQQATSGRSWKAEELRLKSNEDLHKLWYVCVKEKNILLADQVFEKKYTDRQGSLRVRINKVKKTMTRILTVIAQRQQVRTRYRQQLEKEYVEAKRSKVEQQLKSQSPPLPQITTEILRAKYFELRKGVDNTKYLQRIFQRNEQQQQRRNRMQSRLNESAPKDFQSFWDYEMGIGERPLQQQILRAHVKNWKSLNLKQRKIIMGFLNARRANDAKASFLKELKILGQKIAHDQVKSRIQGTQAQAASQ